MKKIIALIIMAALVLTLCSCGNTPTPVPTIPDDLQYSEFAKNFAAYNRNDMSDKLAARLTEEAKAQGFILTWTKNGEALLSEKDPDTIIYYGEWPKNAFSKGLPVPECRAFGVCEESYNGFNLILDWSSEQAKDYAGKLSELGFNKRVDESETDTAYEYSAHNEDGVYVNVIKRSAIGIFKISRDNMNFGWPEKEMKTLFGDSAVIPEFPYDKNDLTYFVKGNTVNVLSDVIDPKGLADWFAMLKTNGFAVSDNYAIKQISDTQYAYINVSNTTASFDLVEKDPTWPVYEVFADLGYRALIDRDFIWRVEASYDPEKDTVTVNGVIRDVFYSFRGFLERNYFQLSDDGVSRAEYVYIPLSRKDPRIKIYVDYKDNTVTMHFETDKEPIYYGEKNMA